MYSRVFAMNSSVYDVLRLGRSWAGNRVLAVKPSNITMHARPTLPTKKISERQGVRKYVFLYTVLFNFYPNFFVGWLTQPTKKQLETLKKKSFAIYFPFSF